MVDILQTAALEQRGQLTPEKRLVATGGPPAAPVEGLVVAGASTFDARPAGDPSQRAKSDPAARKLRVHAADCLRPAPAPG
jgi:hypothetical protein